MLNFFYKILHGLLAKLQLPVPQAGYSAYTTEFDEELWADEIEPSGPVLPSDLSNKEREERHQTALAVIQSQKSPNLESSEDIAISILIDHSGSMKSWGIYAAFAIAESIRQSCAETGIPHEILGFTTVDWRGEPVRSIWQRAGPLVNPGRLCALRHIIYQDFDQTRALDLALMLRPQILKENIDGEAVQWAAKRLESQTQNNKRLLVLSDGAPVDDATLFHNDNYILFNHLNLALEQIQASSMIEIGGVGLGCDVGTFFPEIARIDTFEDLDPGKIDQICAWLFR